MEENSEVLNEGNIANEEAGDIEPAPVDGGEEQFSENMNLDDTEQGEITSEEKDETNEESAPVGNQEQEEENQQTEEDGEKVEENEGKEGEESDKQKGSKGSKPKPLLKPEELPEGVVISTEVAAGYDCTYCKCVLNSEVMLLSHVKGSRHKQNMKFSKTGVGRFVKAKSSGKKSTIIEPLSKLDVPVVGLSHIIETQSPNAEPIFKCNLCHVSCFANAMIDHIVGNRHRCAYLKHVDPEMSKEVEKNFPRKGEHTKEVLLRVANLEQLKGRGSIQVKIASSPSQVKTAATTANRITGRDIYSTKDGSKRSSDGYQSASKRLRPLMGDYPDTGFFDSSRSDYRSLMDSQGLVSYPRLGSQGYGGSRSNLEIGALKHLTDYVITNDDDAKVVSDVVNSLTQSVIQYKLRNLPTSVRELLYKTMNNEGKSIESILGFTGGENLKVIDKFNTMSRHSSTFDDLSGSWGNDDFLLHSSTARTSLRSLDDTSYYQRDKDRYSRSNTYKDDPLYSGSTSTWSSRDRTGGGTGYSSITSGSKDYFSSYRKF